MFCFIDTLSQSFLLVVGSSGADFERPLALLAGYFLVVLAQKT
jgi:hypothetical protein